MSSVLTHQPIIAKGANAGRFRPITDLMLDRATAMKATIVQLKLQGFTVIGGDINGARPSILIEVCTKCQELITSGQAVYNVRGPDYRQGQWLLGDCHVVWMERGH